MDLSDIQKLRKQTGAGLMDVKEALEEAKGDLEKAQDILRKKGASIAVKKGDRDAGNGLIFSYIHSGGRVGVLLKLNCETDFVAKTEQFQELGKDIAMHIAALKPQYISEQDIPEDVIKKEKEIYTEQAKNEDKPTSVLEKIIEGKVDKFSKDNSLIHQSFVKDPDKTVKDRIEEVVAVLGENIQVGEFVCFEI